MQLTRRELAKNTILMLAIASVAPATLLESGCTNGDTIKTLLNEAINSLSAILKITNPTEPWAVALTNALAALQKAEADWQAGGTITLVIDALQTAENVLAVIPVTAQYSPLIDLAVAGIIAVLQAIPASQKATMKVMARPNLHVDRIKLKTPHVFQSHTGAYRAQWNALAKDLGYADAKI